MFYVTCDRSLSGGEMVNDLLTSIRGEALVLMFMFVYVVDNSTCRFAVDGAAA